MSVFGQVSHTPSTFSWFLTVFSLRNNLCLAKFPFSWFTHFPLNHNFLNFLYLPCYLHGGLEVGLCKHNHFPTRLDNVTAVSTFCPARLPILFFFLRSLFNLCGICGWISWYIILSTTGLKKFFKDTVLTFKLTTPSWQMSISHVFSSRNRKRMGYTLQKATLSPQNLLFLWCPLLLGIADRVECWLPVYLEFCLPYQSYNCFYGSIGKEAALMRES